jgi:CHAT domain-containing protein/tetratricopeptide (TPR) repeat protein
MLSAALLWPLTAPVLEPRQDIRTPDERVRLVQELVDTATELRGTDTEEALALLDEAFELGRGLLEVELAVAEVRLRTLLADAENAQHARNAVDWGTRLAFDYRMRGRYDEGIAVAGRVLLVAAALEPPDPELEGRCAEEAGYVFELGGHFDEARLAYEQALATGLEGDRRRYVLEHLTLVLVQQGRLARAQSLVEQHPNDMTPNTVATVQGRLGRLDKAGQTIERAVASLGAPGAWRERANATLTWSMVLIEQAENARAQGVLRELIGELEENEDAKYERFGALHNLAVSLIEDGRAAEALEPLKRAETLANEIGVEWLSGYAIVTRANVHEKLGESEAAIELAERASAIFEAASTLDVVASLWTIAAASVDLGQLDRAAETIRRAESILDGGEDQFGTRREAARFRSRFERWGDITQDLTAARLAAAAHEDERPGLVRFGFEAAGRWKGRMLLEGITARRGEGPRTWDTLERLAASDRALIEFVTGSERLFAYVLVYDRLEFIDLCEGEEIEARVDGYRSLLAEGPGSRAAEVALLGGEIYDELVAPVIQRLPESVTHLTFVPTPKLAALPFEALVVDAPDDLSFAFADVVFLGDRYSVTYAPSTPVLARLASLDPPTVAGGRSLILADPAYRTEREVAARSAEDELGRLPSTRDEALRLAQLLVRATGDDPVRLAELLDLQFGQRSGAVIGAAFDLFVGDQASVARLEEDLSDYSLIHCAVHGLIDAEDPARSGLALSWEPTTGGRIDLAAIRQLELEGPLVVLSACDTARGEILRGEGVQSVAQAFLEAGSRAVVASLWQVRDEEAMRTMQSFYAGMLEEGLAPGEALRRAKRALRKSPSRGIPASGVGIVVDPAHPYYWAPFIYVGAE